MSSIRELKCFLVRLKMGERIVHNGDERECKDDFKLIDTETLHYIARSWWQKKDEQLDVFKTCTKDFNFDVF